LIGEELSVFAVCDGKDYKVLNTAQDHKLVFNNDSGPNTGGMGANSPTPLSTENMIDQTCKNIIEPTLKAMNDKGHPYTGFLYTGLMIVDNMPYVIEYNVRMGDPETQVVLPLLDSSLFNLLYKSTIGSLSGVELKIIDKTAVTVVLASEGYPGQYEKNMKISMNTDDNDLVFHAGTAVLSIIFNSTPERDPIVDLYKRLKSEESRRGNTTCVSGSPILTLYSIT
jgi:phosphoribosylamine--glycine ligase